MELLARIELATSSLPRKCSTPELQEQMALLKMERVAGIEPAPSAWKAEVLPLNHTRMGIRYGNMVVGEGFEPSKLSRQSYSLLGLTAPQPHRVIQACLLMVC